MTKQNKNRKGQATLEEMVQSGSQLILMHDDGTEQPIEEIANRSFAQKTLKSHYEIRNSLIINNRIPEKGRRVPKK